MAKRKATAAAALLALALVPARAAELPESARPAYRFAENLTDGVYGILSAPLNAAFAPKRGASPRLEAVSAESSEARFAEELSRKQDRAGRAILDAMPRGSVGAAELGAWRARAVSEETKAASDALAATFAERYGLLRFGRDADRWAREGGNWDARTAASTVVLGGAYAFVAGLRGRLVEGPAQVDFDLNAGRAWLGGDARLATVRLSPRGSPLFVRAELGSRGGRAACDEVGAGWTGRF